MRTTITFFFGVATMALTALFTEATDPPRFMVLILVAGLSLAFFEDIKNVL
jgi:hypothetical protein